MKHCLKYIFPFFFLILWVPFSFAQVIYYPYYGKNKVLYEKFNWNSYKTDHFNIYYYTQNSQALKNVAEMAESAYQRISTELKHPLSSLVPLIFYKTSTDFEQTNLFQLPEGVLGVAEPMLYRIAIQGDMTLDEIQDLIEHELTHIFEYDLLWGSPGGPIYAVNQPPGWAMEGFAEYNTQKWSSWSTLIVRDAVLNDRIPELVAPGNLYSRYPLPRPPDYDFGHAIFDFIESKHGKTGIREFWHSLKSSPLIGRRNPVKKTFKLKYNEFNQEFKKYLRARYKDFLLRENPEDYSIPLGPQFPQNPYYFSLSQAVSPSGDIVAVLTQNVKDYDLDIILISTKDGSVVKNVTKGYTLKYEHIKFEIDPAQGKDIAWSSDGDMIAFFARTGKKHSLFLLNVLTGKIVRKLDIPVDQPSSPCFLPQGDELLFTAFHEGIHDIFKINLSTQKILNLTEDDLFEKAPTISPDGTKVAYTIHLDTYDKLFLSPPDNLKKRTQLTFGKGNTISPCFSQDSKELYFSGDMRDAFNIYSLSLENGELKRYTDVRTGNFFPMPLPNDPQKIIFCSFNKGAFQVFKSELKGEVEKTITFTEALPAEELKRFEPIISLDIDNKKIKPYKGIGKLYLTSRPPIDTVLTTDGSLYGGTALSFSDLLGDYSIFIMAYQVRSFKSYQFSFLNQKRRLQYMASAFQYTLYYYLNTYYDPFYYDRLTYFDATAVRKITGINFSAYYPFNKYYRTQASIGYYNYEEDYLMASPGTYAQFWNGSILSASIALIGETTRFKYPYGPIAGNTFMLSLTQALPVSSSFLQNTTFEADLRKYLNISSDALLAVRFKGFFSRGKNPYVFYWGGNNEVRSSDFYSIIANEGWFTNLEFRFPLINALSTIIGQLGPVRGTIFFDITRAKIKGYPAKFYTYTGDDALGFPQFRQADAIGSYGYGFEFFFLGLPIHLEFVRRLEFPDLSNPFNMDREGNFKTRFWIGFDF
jgi:Tol biopolymer transport system component